MRSGSRRKLSQRIPAANVFSHSWLSKRIPWQHFSRSCAMLMAVKCNLEVGDKVKDKSESIRFPVFCQSWVLERGLLSPVPAGHGCGCGEMLDLFVVVIAAAAPTIGYDDQLKSPQSLRGGQKFIIETTIGGVPTPTTSWTRNGQPLTPTDQLTIDVTPTSSKLTITGASTDHSGSYVLKAENAVGSTTAEFTITVKGCLYVQLYSPCTMVAHQ